MNESIDYSLSPNNMKELPFHKYDQNFTFIVNDKAYNTNRIVADLLSPYIRQLHYIDFSINEFYLKTKQPMNDETTNHDYFKDFLSLSSFDNTAIDQTRRKYYSAYFYILGNIEEYSKLQPNYTESLTIDNVVNRLHSISEVTSIITFDANPATLFFEEIIEFAASHFEELDKKGLKKLSIEMIEEILKCRKLKLDDEDSLLKFVLSLYKDDHSFSILFDYVDFGSVSEKSFQSFMKEIEFQFVNNGIWRSICSRIVGSKSGAVHGGTGNKNDDDGGNNRNFGGFDTDKNNGGFECINDKEKCGQTSIEKEDTDKNNLKNDELNQTVCLSGPFCEESNNVSENQKQNLNDNLNPNQSNQNFIQTESLTSNNNGDNQNTNSNIYFFPDQFNQTDNISSNNVANQNTNFNNIFYPGQFNQNFNQTDSLNVNNNGFPQNTNLNSNFYSNQFNQNYVLSNNLPANYFGQNFNQAGNISGNFEINPANENKTVSNGNQLLSQTEIAKTKSGDVIDVNKKLDSKPVSGKTDKANDDIIGSKIKNNSDDLIQTNNIIKSLINKIIGTETTNPQPLTTTNLNQVNNNETQINSSCQSNSNNSNQSAKTDIKSSENTTQLNNTNTNQVNNVTTNQVNNINTNLTNNATTNQVNNTNTNQINNVTTNQVNNTNTNQINNVQQLGNDNISQTIKEFSHEKGKEFNGIMRYLTNKTGKNIHFNKTIEITSNSVYWNNYPMNLVDYNSENFYQSLDVGGATVCFDFKNKSIQLTSYSIQSLNRSENGVHLKNWVMEVSNDGKKWIEIDRHQNDSRLNGPNFKSVFIINKPQTDFYRFVRLRQIGQSWYECSNHNYFAIAFIEFYGKLKEPNE